MEPREPRGCVRGIEARDGYRVAWYEEERADVVLEEPLEDAKFDDPAEALQWARLRAPVVIIERETEGGAYGDFSAGRRPPIWAPRLARLDEAAMLARVPAPWPHDGDFFWSRADRRYEQGPATRLSRDAHDARSAVHLDAVCDDAAARISGATDDERIEQALEAFAAQLSTETQLRIAFAGQAIDLGDNHLLNADDCEHVLLPLLDCADRRRLIAYLLLQVSPEGMVREINIVDIRRTIEF